MVRLSLALLVGVLALGCGSKTEPEPKQLEYQLIETQPGASGDGAVEPGGKPKLRVLPPK